MSSYFEQDNMKLIGVDECGDEVEVAGYTLRGLIDDDELAIWEQRKIEKAHERYPEFQRFYFEDRRNWDSMINEMLFYER